jgi:hypothetical protein
MMDDTPRTQQQVEFPYPFVSEEFQQIDEDGSAAVQTWRPGVRYVDDRYGDSKAIADGIGAQIITVVARFKPDGWPERVFYTRQWKDPDGKLFGKRRLHIRAAAQFTELTRGYRHGFEMSPAAPEVTGNE